MDKSPPQAREVLARLWPEQVALNDRDVWLSVRFSDAMRVVAYAPEQEAFVESLRDLLRQGALARLENESEGGIIRLWQFKRLHKTSRALSR